MPERFYAPDVPTDRVAAAHAYWKQVAAHIRADRRSVSGKFAAFTGIDSDCQECDVACLGARPVVHDFDIETIRFDFASRVRKLAQDHFDERAEPDLRPLVETVQDFKESWSNPRPPRSLDGLNEEAWVVAEERRIIAAGEIEVAPRLTVRSGSGSTQFGMWASGVLDVDVLTVRVIENFVAEFLQDSRTRQFGPAQRFGLEEMERYWERTQASRWGSSAVQSPPSGRELAARAAKKRARQRKQRERGLGFAQ